MRLITIIVALLASCLLSAQTLQQKMLEDPKTGASIYRPYFTVGGAVIYTL